MPDQYDLLLSSRELATKLRELEAQYDDEYQDCTDHIQSQVSLSKRNVVRDLADLLCPESVGTVTK